eukprot:COSAG04_NODE_3042_length_3244_cov_6.312242_1_plen_101_part_10
MTRAAPLPPAAATSPQAKFTRGVFIGASAAQVLVRVSKASALLRSSRPLSWLPPKTARRWLCSRTARAPQRSALIGGSACQPPETVAGSSSALASPKPPAA